MFENCIELNYKLNFKILKKSMDEVFKFWYIYVYLKMIYSDFYDIYNVLNNFIKK